MQCIETPCDRCQNKRKEMINKYHPTCNAFPDGIPYKFLRENDVTQIKECNNGIGFEEEQK